MILVKVANSNIVFDKCRYYNADLKVDSYENETYKSIIKGKDK
jgi:hypothetical protein